MLLFPFRSIDFGIYFIIYFIIFSTIIEIPSISSFNFQLPNLWKKSIQIQKSIQPVIQIDNNLPVLVVTDPISKCRIHIVGVSHGSQASAQLVKQVMLENCKPKCVILELCEDRFLSISLDAKVQPRNNASMTKFYNDRINSKRAFELNENQMKHDNIFNNLYSTFNFVKSQGFIGGTFISLGLLVSNIQRLGLSKEMGDEFVTAMKISEQLKIPVKLADANQNDTLKSIRNILKEETFDLREIVKNTKLLGFSALGLAAESSFPSLARKIQENNKINNTSILRQSRWINIPSIYIQQPKMLQSLTPLLVTLLLSSILTYAPFEESIPTQIDSNSGSSSFGILTSLLTMQVSDQISELINFAMDMFGFILLIRMAKLIGTDRDYILASNIQKICKSYPPESEIVCVVGMLHCNGVARWLASGEDPINFIDRV